MRPATCVLISWIRSSFRFTKLLATTAHPFASLLVDRYDDDWSQLWWVRIDGAARVVAEDGDRRRALDHLCAKYEQYRAQPPPGAVIAIDVASWVAWP